VACHVLGAGPVKTTAEEADLLKVKAKSGNWRDVERLGRPQDRQLLDYAIAKGEAGVYLRLSPEQYSRLRRP
jgi:hypothetical protein